MSKTTKCPVCETTLTDWARSKDSTDNEYFTCPLCGEYIATYICISDLPSLLRGDAAKRMSLSHSLRKMQRQNRRPLLTSELSEKYVDLPLPRPKEQADHLIRWFGENLSHPGEEIEIHPARMKSIIGAHTDEGFALVVQHLFDQDILSGYQSESMGSVGIAQATLSFDGWELFEEMIRGHGIHGQAFIAMKFGDEILDKVIGEIFTPSILEAGFKLIRLDKEPQAGLIDNRMRVEIQNSDFLIADLTHENAGAYWEAGYAEGLGKPVFYTCEKSKFEKDRTHFDTNHHFTVVWDKESPKAAGDDLKLAIRATLPHLAKMSD